MDINILLVLQDFRNGAGPFSQVRRFLLATAGPDLNPARLLLRIILIACASSRSPSSSRTSILITR